MGTDVQLAAGPVLVGTNLTSPDSPRDTKERQYPHLLYKPTARLMRPPLRSRLRQVLGTVSAA
jgi:hypothetical protein